MSAEPIRRSVTVRCPRERAFRVFTEEIDTWWPVETHSRAVSDFEGEEVKVERVEFQTSVGGQVLEYLSNGQILPWGDVLVFEPPTRFILAWKPGFSERPPTELEVRFTPHGDHTLVELEHRSWELLGPDVAELRGDYAEGWILTLERFRRMVEEEA
jgi:uncharacterized protein YndB with AHSA1/START domain